MSQTLSLFLLLNIVPLVAAVVLGVLWLRGDIELREVPEGFSLNLIVLLGALVALGLVASVSLPAAHRSVRRLEQAMRRGRDVLFGRESGSRILATLSFPLLLVVYLVAWPIRLLLILAAFALIAVVLVFLIRLFDPTFLEGSIGQIVNYRL